jgi:alkanesulfonate monooxygenase SsuD/methylene tetrahydromethanopterin reductase-like flavin-dependent oxidoreductase (luciferase family)
VKARRKDVEPRDVIVVGDDDDLRARLEEFVTQGASKFVVLPVAPPRDWGDELQRLYNNVVVPLES